MRDLIFVSMEDWDEVWRRNQFICAELARRHPNHKVLFIGLPVNISHGVRQGKRGEVKLGGRLTGRAKGFENVGLAHPWKWLPNSLAGGRWVNEITFRTHVRKVAAGMGLRDPVLWLNPHYAVHMVGRMGERGVVYDVTDDWTTISQSPRLTELVKRQDAELCARADATIVCSPRLYELKRSMCRNLHLIPNGVHSERYRGVLDGGIRIPADAKAWRSPVFGYTGTIHPDRVDVELVEQVARGLSSGTIVLLGPNHLSAADRARLLCTGRVALPGPVAYDTIPSYMRAFDVCITPHRVTSFTDSLNPIKLWEYLAAGKPIVSTNVAGFRDYPQFVRIASGAKEFIAAVQEAGGEAPEVGEARRDEAKRHSWSARVDAIERVLAECVPETLQGAA